MYPYLLYATIVFATSMVGLFVAYFLGVPLAYTAIVPALAGACIAAFKGGGAKK